jgi:hypothetical protein
MSSSLTIFRSRTLWSIQNLLEKIDALTLSQSEPPRIQVRIRVDIRYTGAIDSLIKRFVSMVTVNKRRKSCSIQDQFKIHLNSIRSERISSLRTHRQPKQSHRRSTTATMMTASRDSFFFKPLQRSLSMCSITSDECNSDEEIEQCRLNENGYQDATLPKILSSMEHVMDTPRTPTLSLRMQPSPCSGLIIENLPFPSLILRPTLRRRYDTNPESSSTHMTTDSTLYLDCSDSEGSSLPFMPEYENDSVTRDMALDEFVLDTPKSGYLLRTQQVLSPPPLRITGTARRIVSPDDFEIDLTTNPSLFLPDAF